MPSTTPPAGGAAAPPSKPPSPAAATQPSKTPSGPSPNSAGAAPASNSPARSNATPPSQGSSPPGGGQSAKPAPVRNETPPAGNGNAPVSRAGAEAVRSAVTPNIRTVSGSPSTASANTPSSNASTAASTASKQTTAEANRTAARPEGGPAQTAPRSNTTAAFVNRAVTTQAPSAAGPTPTSSVTGRPPAPTPGPTPAANSSASPSTGPTTNQASGSQQNDKNANATEAEAASILSDNQAFDLNQVRRGLNLGMTRSEIEKMSATSLGTAIRAVNLGLPANASEQQVTQKTLSLTQLTPSSSAGQADTKARNDVNATINKDYSDALNTGRVRTLPTGDQMTAPQEMAFRLKIDTSGVQPAGPGNENFQLMAERKISALNGNSDVVGQSAEQLNRANFEASMKSLAANSTSGITTDKFGTNFERATYQNMLDGYKSVFGMTGNATWADVMNEWQLRNPTTARDNGLLENPRSLYLRTAGVFDEMRRQINLGTPASTSPPAKSGGDAGAAPRPMTPNASSNPSGLVPNPPEEEDAAARRAITNPPDEPAAAPAPTPRPETSPSPAKANASIAGRANTLPTPIPLVPNLPDEPSERELAAIRRAAISPEDITAAAPAPTPRPESSPSPAKANASIAGGANTVTNPLPLDFFLRLLDYLPTH